MNKSTSARVWFRILCIPASFIVLNCGQIKYTLDPPSGTATLETKTERLWMDTTGILWAVVTPKAVEDLPAAKEAVDAQARLSKGKRVPVLYNMSQLASITDDARNYFYQSDESVAVSSAFAVVQPSRFSVFMCNAIGLPMLKPRIESRCFVDENEAYAWLRTFLATNSAPK